MKYLIVGLGNIGAEYKFTRHNIGYLILDRMAHLYNLKFQINRLAYTSEMEYKGRMLHLIKPTTYMNLSGKTVNHYFQLHKISRENLLIITDDIALSYGKIRIKPRGSAGGHNGLKNIEQCIGDSNYPRLRFGIGNEFSKGRQEDYVLSPFTPKEIDQLVPNMDHAIDAVYSLCTIGIERTMNHFN